jgi:hypothetical protein
VPEPGQLGDVPRTSQVGQLGRGMPVTVPSQWDHYAEQLRQKLPAAPEGLLAGYVQWGPWVAIVLGALGALALLGLLLVVLGLSPLLLLGGASGVYAGGSAFLSIIIGLLSTVPEIVGGVLMLQRRLTGWWLLTLGLLVGAIGNLLSFSPFGLLITLLIAYIHIQVKPRYS